MTERPLWLAIAFCIVVRAVLQLGYGLGFELDPWLWQLVDPRLLRDDTLRSLYLMHAQPPLFNALLALALKLPEGFAGPFLHLVLQAMSIVSDIISGVSLAAGCKELIDPSDSVT